MPGSPLSPHARVARAAARQCNAINDRQLRDLDIPSWWVRSNVQTGFLTPADSSVYVVGLEPGKLPRDTCAAIGLLRTTGTAALCFESSMERQGLWSRGPADIHVMTVGQKSTQLAGLARDVTLFSHRTRALESSDLILAKGLPSTTALRTIPELGARLKPLQIAHIIWNALYAECVDLFELERRLDEMKRVPGTAAARSGLAWVQRESCGTKSRSEDEFVDIVERTGLPFPLVNVLGAAGLPGVRLDFVWPEQRVVFELDGRHHAAMPGIAKSDRAVTNVLRSDGWSVLRRHYTHVWNDPIGIAMLLGRALGA